MEAMTKCPLCGLDAGSLPYRQKDKSGVSCRRCGDFYIDGMLICGGSPSDDRGRAILSGYTKWASILGKPPVDINVSNIKAIISDYSELTQYDKVDYLLKFLSIKEPRAGYFINLDKKYDIPVIYSADEDELMYLLSDFAQNELGYLEYVSRSSVKITPSGWGHIHLTNKIQLASDKYDLMAAIIDEETDKKIADAKEKAGIVGNRYSSGLAYQIEAFILEAANSKLENKLQIDKDIIFGTEAVLDPDNAVFLSNRINRFYEKEKTALSKILRDNFEDCRAMSFYEVAKDRLLGKYVRSLRLLQISLKTAVFDKKETILKDKRVFNMEETQEAKSVWVVHGRNENARRALFQFLRAVGLNPIEWGEAMGRTKKGAPFVGEVLDEGFRIARAVIVLLTGDDVARLREEYVSPREYELEGRPSPQPRANVIFEAGRAFGTHPDNTILVELENETTKAFSNIVGRHVLRMSNKAEKRHELVSRLRTAGCEVCIDGRQDWLSEGNFDGAALGWHYETSKQASEIRGDRQAQMPVFDRGKGTSNITGFSKKQIWNAALEVLAAEKIDIIKTSDSWIFAKTTKGDQVEVDIGIVDHPERDDLRPWAPAVSMGIDIPKYGELVDNHVWSLEQRQTLSNELYDKIINILYRECAK
jgi:predicted nucleotide-binding protein